MGTLQSDVTQLTNDVASNKALIGQVATANAAAIANLQSQITALQGQANPDLSSLESAIATLEANNSQLTSLAGPAPAPPSS